MTFRLIFTSVASAVTLALSIIHFLLTHNALPTKGFSIPIFHGVCLAVGFLSSAVLLALAWAGYGGHLWLLQSGKAYGVLVYAVIYIDLSFISLYERLLWINAAFFKTVEVDGKSSRLRQMPFFFSAFVGFFCIGFSAFFTNDRLYYLPGVLCFADRCCLAFEVWYFFRTFFGASISGLNLGLHVASSALPLVGVAFRNRCLDFQLGCAVFLYLLKCASVKLALDRAQAKESGQAIPVPHGSSSRVAIVPGAHELESGSERPDSRGSSQVTIVPGAHELQSGRERLDSRGSSQVTIVQGAHELESGSEHPDLDSRVVGLV